MTTLGKTALAAAFERAGAQRPIVAEFMAELSRFMARGLTLAELRACVARVEQFYELPGEGHFSFATEGQAANADARQPNGDGEGQKVLAKDGQATNAPSAATIGHNAQRDPTATQIGAVESAKNVMALSIFDRQTTARGARWGNIYYSELSSMSDDGRLAAEVKAHIGQVGREDRYKKIRELMTPQQFHACLRKAGIRAVSP